MSIQRGLFSRQLTHLLESTECGLGAGLLAPLPQRNISLFTSFAFKTQVAGWHVVERHVCIKEGIEAGNSSACGFQRARTLHVNMVRVFKPSGWGREGVYEMSHIS